MSSSSSSWSSSSYRRRSYPPPDHERRRKKKHRAHLPTSLASPFDPSIPLMTDNIAFEPDSEPSFEASPAAFKPRRTETLSSSPETAPDLLQLFKIFQFNRPERTPLRMLVNVTLIGSIQSIRLLVTHDASVQDVIKASLKAYAKEGRLPRHCFKHQAYGLHFSPFCLESIDPTEAISSLMTRNFFLSPSSQQFHKPRERKAWWKFFRFH